ncbi:Membrane protein of ER body protein [Spatholobus suberectus]|nr:Membrane protein of ER body protein [Spatholobus suberectus]
MEQVHYHWAVKEKEEEEQQLQDAALKGRQSLQHGRDSIIATVVAPSFSSAPTSNAVCSASVSEQPLLLKEEVLHNHTHEEEHKEQPTRKVEGTSNVTENDNNFNDDSEAVGLGIVADFVENAMNGEAISSATINDATSPNKNSVYFDKPQGMWKCHHCTWTEQFDSPWNVPRENLNGYSYLLMNVKTMIQHGPCFVLPSLPIAFDIGVENSDTQCSPCNEVNNQCVETVDNKVPSGSELLPLPNSSEIQAATVENCGDESSAKAYPNLTEEIDQQLKELDVEAVLAKQETHDLFCPNCKSCITKRVILRKRKRNLPNLDTKAKRDKSATEVVDSSVDEANQGDNAIAISNVGRVEPPADNCEPEREPEVFRCLSCFSFFIPIRNGIKLFPSFGVTREPETSQKPSSNVENPSIVVAASNANNWFLALLTSNKERKASAQGDATIEDSRTDPAESSSFTNVLTSPGVDNPESSLASKLISQNVNLTPDIIKPGHGGVNSPIPSIVKSVVKIKSWVEKGNKSNVVLQNEPLVDQNDSCTESSSDVVNGLQKVRGDFSATEQLLTENVRTDLGEKNHDSVDVIKTDIVADISKRESVLLATIATSEIHFNAVKPAKDAILRAYEGSPIFEKTQKDVDKTPEKAQDSYSSLMEEAQSPDQSYGSVVVANDVASDKQVLE